jgi:truncated hemoglobin YjbI
MEKGYIETFKVLEEVLLLHYKFQVGLTPLNPTAHDLVHNNMLPIHPKILIGEWRKLYAEYFSFLSETAIKKYDELLETEKENKHAVFPKVLEMKPVKIVIQGMSNTIDEKQFNRLMIENRMKQVDKITYNQGDNSR